MPAAQHCESKERPAAVGQKIKKIGVAAGHIALVYLIGQGVNNGQHQDSSCGTPAVASVTQQMASGPPGKCKKNGKGRKMGHLVESSNGQTDGPQRLGCRRGNKDEHGVAEKRCAGHKGG